MLLKRSPLTPLFALLLMLVPTVVQSADDPSLDDDLELLQGTWELRHGNEGKGLPTIRSVKTITGNRETLRRYSIETGQMMSEKTVEFELHDAEPVRVFTFFPVNSPKKVGYSFIYKVEKDDLYDITGLLHGTEYRDYSTVPTMWRWKRITEEPAPESKAGNSNEDKKPK
jgi:hypothetical protein